MRATTMPCASAARSSCWSTSGSATSAPRGSLGARSPTSSTGAATTTRLPSFSSSGCRSTKPCATSTALRRPNRDSPKSNSHGKTTTRHSRYSPTRTAFSRSFNAGWYRRCRRHTQTNLARGRKHKPSHHRPEDQPRRRRQNRRGGTLHASQGADWKATE